MNIGTASGVETALGAALRGAWAAGDRFASAATRIAASGAETPRAPDPVSSTTAVLSLLAAQEAPDLGREMVQARLAQYAYAANLATLRTADQMAAEALRLLR